MPGTVVPVATMQKNCDALVGENDVWAAWQFGEIFQDFVTMATKFFGQGALDFRSLTGHPLHLLGDNR